MKYKDYEDEKLYRRGRDFPPHSSGHDKDKKECVKMSMGMYGKEIKRWFREEELEAYPDNEAYIGSLP